MLLLLTLLAAACSHTPKQTADPGPREVYQTPDGQLQILVPVTWESEERLTDQAYAVVFTKEGRRMLTVANYGQEMMGPARAYMVPDSEEPIMVDGRAALSYEVQDQSDGESDWPKGRIPHVLIPAGHRFYLFTARQPELNEVLHSVAFR